jgi:hypothetical protein
VVIQAQLPIGVSTEAQTDASLEINAAKNMYMLMQGEKL